MFIDLLSSHLTLIGSIIGIFVSALFIISIIIKRNDIADIAWGTGIFIVALASFITLETPPILTWTLTALALLWGGRLSLRILLRNIKKTEDPRYKKWRDAWGSWFYVRSYFQVYLLQGALMVVIGYPFVHAALYANEAPFGAIQMIGIFIWCVGFFFEVVGDWQLDRFLADPQNRGKIMSSGLWRYSRHPNYFGEITMWWGIWLMVATLPFGILALVSPLMITFLITKVSGIPMLEERFSGNAEFESYKKRTSVLIPLPPRSSATD